MCEKCGWEDLKIHRQQTIRLIGKEGSQTRVDQEGMTRQCRGIINDYDNIFDETSTQIRDK